MNKSHNHPYHIVTISPWPILTSLRLIIILTGAIKWFYEFNIIIFIWGIFILNLCNYQWWRDVTRERTYQGCHTLKIINLIKYGIILFITSEIFFFISFFWAFFHISLSPRIEIGNTWPPHIISPFNPFNIPLLNTIVLLSSGVTITWSHYRILNKNYKERIYSLITTILLGIYFSLLQAIEYIEATFTISDSSYGTTFFIITGFHGLHVIIGTLFILVRFLRLINRQFSSYHHLGFEISSWYWHFVDVVWLFVYIFIYWWRY